MIRVNSAELYISSENKQQSVWKKSADNAGLLCVGGVIAHVALGLVAARCAVGDFCARAHCDAKVFTLVGAGALYGPLCEFVIILILFGN